MSKWQKLKRVNMRAQIKRINKQKRRSQAETETVINMLEYLTSYSFVLTKAQVTLRVIKGAT